MIMVYRHQRLITVLCTLAFGALLLAALPASAQPTAPPGQCDGFNPSDPYGLDCGQYSGLSDDDPRLITARVINVSLSLLGILATVIILVAGFRWMTSGGNEDQIKGAQKMIIAATIGLAVILSAYAISNFALTKIGQATDPTIKP